MDRRTFLGTLAGGLLAAPLSAEAQQQAGRVPRIGFLSGGSPVGLQVVVMEEFRRGLREVGLVEGQNVVVDYRWAEGQQSRLPELAMDLVRLTPDVIVAATSPSAMAAYRATAAIPIVMLAVLDPVGSGLVASLARPGGNITGLIATASPRIVGKHLELLREAVPKVSRVAVLRNPKNPDAAQMSREVEGAARTLGVQLQAVDARGPNESDSAFAAMTRDRAGALLLLGDTMFFLQRSRIASLAAKSRLPTVSGAGEMAEAGLLMTYGRSLSHDFRRAAAYVDKILKGAKPGDLPIEQATKFELIINLKTAKVLGLTIPPSLLQRADQVIE